MSRSRFIKALDINGHPLLLNSSKIKEIRVAEEQTDTGKDIIYFITDDKEMYLFRGDVEDLPNECIVEF